MRSSKATVEALVSFNDMQNNQFSVRSLHDLPSNELPAYLRGKRELEPSAFREKSEHSQRTYLDSARELDTHFDHVQNLALSKVEMILMQHAVDPKALSMANGKRTCNLVLSYGFSSQY